MGKLRNVAALGALVSVAVLALGWFLLVSPQRAAAKDARTQADAERSTSVTLGAQVASLRSQAKDLPAQRARLDEISAKLPPSPAEPSLLRSLTQAAADSGVDLASVAPGAPALVAAPAPAAASTAARAAAATGTAAPAGGAVVRPRVPVVATAAAGQLASISVSLTVTGTYAQIEQFQHELEQLPRVWRTTALTLAPGHGPRTAAAQAAAAARAAAAAAAAGPAGATSQASSSTTPSAASYDGQLTATVSGLVFMTVPPATTQPATAAAAAHQ